jgi:arylsulfatase A-like enzyme
MMNTHGNKFYFRNPHFSIGAINVKRWHIDSYDDAILNYDIYVKEVISLLKSEGILDNTIFIINSDHGMRWKTTEAIPLIIRFPNSEYAGRVAEHSQRIDIAPTLLDYMGVEAPGWMEGVSLIDQATRPPRIIFVANRTASETVNGWRQVVNPSAPFYTLGTLALINCNQWFRLNVRKNKFEYLDLKTQSMDCKSSDAITKEQARDLLFEHLDSRGYDISSLTDSSFEMAN